MIKSNRIEFTNSKINMLSFTKKLYTNSEAFRVNGKQYRLKLRVTQGAKAFCIYHNQRRITLGSFDKSFGVVEATYEAIKVINGETHIAPVKRREDSFAEYAEKVFEKKRKQGKQNVDQEIRAFRAVPSHILKKPISEITREDVIDWKEEILDAGKSWNHAVAVPNNVWNVASDNWAYSILENKRNPFSRTKEKFVRQAFAVPNFSQLKEIWRVANECHPTISLLIKLKILTGMHQTEMLRLKFRDVQDCGEWLEIDHKIGVKHKIFLTPKVQELLQAFIKLHNLSLPNSPLFSLDGVNPVSKALIHREWTRATKKLSVRFQMSKLRHALVTEMEDTGYQSKFITGHCYKENIQAKHYKNWDSEKMKDIFRKANTFWQEKVYLSLNNQWF